MSSAHPAADSPAAASDVLFVRWFVRIALAVGLVAAGAQLAEIPWRSALRGYDNTFNYLWLRSLMVDGDWDFANDLAICDTLTEPSRELALGLPRPATGRMPNKYGVGWAMITVPAYIVADLVVRGGTAAGIWDLSRDGFNPVYQICIFTWHVLLACLALVLARQVVAAWVPDPWATAGVATVWFGGSLLYYHTSNVGMSHGVTFLAVTIAAWAMVCGLARPRAVWPWLAAGAGLGLAAVTRFQSIVFGLLAIWALVERVRQHGWRGLSAIGWMAMGAAPFLLVQSWAWHVVYDRWLVFSYGSEGETFNWAEPQLIGTLFSSWHGLYYWHPLLLLATVGLVWWTWRGQGPALAWVGTVLATIYINAAWWCWWFGAAFGNRAFDAALLAMMTGQAWLLARSKPRQRRWLMVACVALAVWNTYIFVLFRTSSIPRGDPVSWVEMVRAAPKLFHHLEFE